jgi:hypothetical protein
LPLRKAFRIPDSRRFPWPSYGEKGCPLGERAGRHPGGVATLIKLLSEVHPDKELEVGNILE